MDKAFGRERMPREIVSAIMTDTISSRDTMIMIEKTVNVLMPVCLEETEINVNEVDGEKRHDKVIRSDQIRSHSPPCHGLILHRLLAFIAKWVLLGREICRFDIHTVDLICLKLARSIVHPLDYRCHCKNKIRGEGKQR
jgi:hypothetical protein